MDTLDEKLNKSKKQNIEEAQLMGLKGKILLGIFFIVLAILLGYLLYGLWPIDTTATSSGNVTASSSSTATINIFGFHWNTSAELKLILLVLVMGMIGRYMHNVMSFVDFTGNRKLVRSWTWQYLLTPFLGAFLALFFYVVVRAGMLSASTTQQDINRYGVLAISGLVGLFSSQAIDKLADIADTLFKKNVEQRGDTLSNPKPTIKGVAASEDEGSWITLSGEGFTQASVVYIDKKIRESVFISNNEMKAKVEDITPKTKIRIKISNPSLGGGNSEEFPWEMPEK